MKKILKVFLQRTVRFFFNIQLFWPKVKISQKGYTLYVGVPWLLKDILDVNLMFVSKCNLENMKSLIIVIDRCYSSEYEPFINETKKQFPDLPLTFKFYKGVPGILIEWFKSVSWYNAFNQITALKNCSTEHIIFHDFDLYPLETMYFENLYLFCSKNNLHITGTQLSNFYGLSTSDNILGTWAQCLDVRWVKNNCRPADFFQAWIIKNGKPVLRDPTVLVQQKTEKRKIVPSIKLDHFCHINNLCSVYFNLINDRKINIAWRIHFLVYLKYLSSDKKLLPLIKKNMDSAQSSILCIKNKELDFTSVDPTCGNVLRDEINKIETCLFNQVRPEIKSYLISTQNFLNKFGVRAKE